MATITEGTTLTVEANGSSIASGAFGTANDDVLQNDLDNSGMPLLRFSFSGAFTTAPSAQDPINLYRRVLDMDGGASADAPAPDTAYGHEYVGSFYADDVGSSTTQYLTLDAVPRHSDLNADEEYYLENGTDQSLNAGWTLAVTPYQISA